MYLVSADILADEDGNDIVSGERYQCELRYGSSTTLQMTEQPGGEVMRCTETRTDMYVSSSISRN
jgi:hypothetical protein